MRSLKVINKYVLFLLIFINSILASDYIFANDYKVTYLPEMTTRRTTSPIIIDGELNETDWLTLPRANNFAEHRPGDQVRPPVMTEAMITYDDENLYVAFIAHDHDPGAIRATLSDRDQYFQDDNIVLAVDTYASAEWAYEFVVNPLGVQGDIVWSQYGDEDSSPDFVWESAGKITDSGYLIEMAIPFSSLRFPNKDEQVWKVDFWRNYPRETRYQMSWAAYDRAESCWPCKWGTVKGINNVKPGKGLEILPSFISYQSGNLDNIRDYKSEWSNNDIKGEASLGIKYALSSDMTAEFTLNPDFSQIESDAAQIDVNSTTALYYSEKRPFFQQGIDLFSTWSGVVYTRMINNPLATAKLIGRVGKTSIAFMSGYDEDSPIIVPFREQSGQGLTGKSFSNIFRFRHSIGEQSHLGGIMTYRDYKGGGYNTVYGLDGAIYFPDNFNIEIQWLGNNSEEIFAPDLFDTSSADMAQVYFDNNQYTVALDGENFLGNSLYASFEKHGKYWEFDADYTESSPTFRADNGYFTRNGRRQFEFSTGYDINYITKLFDYISPSAGYAKVWKYNGGGHQDEWLWWEISLQLKGQSSLSFGNLWSREDFRGIFFDKITRNHINFSTNFSDMLKGGIYFSAGHTIYRDNNPVMGREDNLSAWLTIKPLNNFYIEPEYNYGTSKELKTDSTLYEGFIFRSRLTYQFTRELFCRIIVQYNDFNQTWSYDPLISYRLSPFSIFYAGASSDIRNFGELGRDVSLQTNRQYFMKLQYLFSI
ncbi:MAG: DUF5916 domain-containing protein [Candidatus Zixiibacteriota bacterium]